MLPPQAPPAHVAPANQSAVATLQRMQATQAWLVAQQDALPDLPSGTDARDAFMTELDAFWEALVEHSPGKPLVPRRRALALRLAEAARDQASLRLDDGTLPGEVVDTIAHVTGQPGDGPLPDHIHAHQLFVGGRSYAGALVLWNDRDPGRVLLFTVDAGWAMFPSLVDLYRDILLDFRSDTETETHAPDTRPFDGNVFDALTRGLIARMRHRVAATFDREAGVVPLQDRLHATLDFSALLDMHAIVRQRDLALAAKVDEERLEHQPARTREHWRRAASDYRDAWRRERNGVAVPSLAWFADTSLWMALRERGIDVPPHELAVRLTRQVPDKPLATAMSGFQSEELSLTALAYRNVVSLPTESLQVIGADGSARDDVPAGTLREVVRDLDLPNRYAHHLDDILGDTPQGKARRASHHALQAARMRFEAADARLAYFNRAEPRSFQEDHGERGFHWVQAVLDAPSPATRKKVEGHEIVVHQLTYRGAPLAGVFLISARQSDAVRRVVLYTPDAPDRIAFREFGDRSELTRDFLLDPGFEGYLLDRLPIEFAAFDTTTGTRHFAATTLNGGRDWAWVFNLSECHPRARCTQLVERFQEREVAGSFLDADYDVSIQLAKRNAAYLARSTARADWDSVFDIWGWNVPFHFVKEFVVGTVQSLPHAAQAGWRFYDDVKAGDGTGAFLAFVEGYSAGLGVLPLYTQVPTSAGARVRAAPGSRALASTRRTLPPPDTLFESRFRAPGVRLPSQKPPASGVYAIDGGHYIRQGEAVFRVRFDADIAGWRLARPGAPDARVTGPAIERLADGRWHFRRVGLLGGSGRASVFATLLEEVKDILDDPMRLTPDVAALSEPQRVVLIAELRRRLDLSEFVGVLRAQVDREVHAFIVTTPAQRQEWNAALQAARATSPSAPPLTLAQALAPPKPTVAATSVPRPLLPIHGPWPKPEPLPGPSTSSAVSGQAASATAPGVLGEVMAGWRIPGQGQRYRVPIMNWPGVAYVYLPRDALARQVGQQTLTLPQLRFLGSVQGVPLTTLPPETLLSAVPDGAVATLASAGRTAEGATLGSAFGAWVRIDLRQMSYQRVGRHVRYRLFRIPQTGGEGYLLREVAQSAASGPTIFGDAPLSLYQNEFQIRFQEP